MIPDTTMIGVFKGGPLNGQVIAGEDAKLLVGLTLNHGGEYRPGAAMKLGCPTTMRAVLEVGSDRVEAALEIAGLPPLAMPKYAIEKVQGDFVVLGYREDKPAVDLVSK